MLLKACKNINDMQYKDDRTIVKSDGGNLCSLPIVRHVPDHHFEGWR